MSKFIKDHAVFFAVVFVVVMLCSTCFCLYWISKTNTILEEKALEHKKHQAEVEERMRAFDEKLKHEETSRYRIDDELKEVKNTVRNLSFTGSVAKSEIASLDFSINTDLKTGPTLTVNDMNKLIAVWDMKSGGSRFLGKGQAFITAAQETGYNPVYLLAHAAVESGWGNSHFAINRGNLFGIGAFDSNPDNAYVMGDSIDQGIINGAKWIDKNYYNNRNAHTLEQMSRDYCTTPSWSYEIASIVQESYAILGSLI